MDNKITLVTAFFDIGRENFNEIPRSKEKYFDYFKRWARIKNELIFVCENQLFADRVLQIRDEYGLKDKTQVILTGNIEEIEPKLLKKMKEIEQDPYFLNFRLKKVWPENMANYNYVMFLKYYSMYLASIKGKVDTRYLAWIDFGFEHGGEVFEDESDYLFEWEYDFGDKVNIFRLPYEEKRPIFDVIRTIHPDSITGPIVISPTSLVKEFYEKLKGLYYSLADIGLMDDDQLYLLYFSRQYPEICEVKETSYWFMAISEYSNHQFKIKERKKAGLFKRILRKIYHIFKRK